ncbi:YcbK family protein [Phyllobacterium leguminum]|nr:D-Ala-D-Ala carboxypeptidase family metallohydrolase [Phyllobacterium leguminum]
MLAVSVAACTATGSSVSPQLGPQGGGLVAETMASVVEGAKQQSQPASADTPPAPEGGTVLALAAEPANPPANPNEKNALQTAAAAALPAATASAIPLPAPSPASAAAGQSQNAQGITQLPAKGVEMVAYTGAPRPMTFATPAVDTAADDSLMRLYVDNPSRKVEREKRLQPKKSAREHNYTLPGVRQDLGFEIKRRSSLDDDSDIDVHEEDGSAVRLASAGGLGRLLPRGLEKQRASVDTACLKPRLVSMLKTIEGHFRRPVIITSGYRSPSYNRLVRGARRSLHMLCEAADIQVEGVSKFEIARFVRALPGRGGVGTYCTTDSVHVDIGPERDWNWRCGARR